MRKETKIMPLSTSFLLLGITMLIAGAVGCLAGAATLVHGSAVSHFFAGFTGAFFMTILWILSLVQDAMNTTKEKEEWKKEVKKNSR